jgi:pantetheine-phosphate adenylyltransferase
MGRQPLRAVYPGSFDPVTLGHLDVVERAAKIADELTVAVLRNTDKAPLFSAEERCEMFRHAIEERGIERVEVVHFEGLLTEFARGRGATIVVRGLRALSDFEYELQMAQLNRRMYPELETLFMTPGEEVSFVSSRMVREIAKLGGDVSGLVPSAALGKVRAKLHRQPPPASD